MCLLCTAHAPCRVQARTLPSTAAPFCLGGEACQSPRRRLKAHETRPRLCDACLRRAKACSDARRALRTCIFSGMDPSFVVDCDPAHEATLAAALGGCLLPWRGAATAAAPRQISAADAGAALGDGGALIILVGAGLPCAAGAPFVAAPRSCRDPLAHYAQLQALQPELAAQPPYAALAELAAVLGDSLFVVTTNVDPLLPLVPGIRQRLLELHGSVARRHCARLCGAPVAPALAGDDAPCRCGAPMRLAITTSRDAEADIDRSVLNEQQQRYAAFIRAQLAEQRRINLWAVGCGLTSESLLPEIRVVREGHLSGARAVDVTVFGLEQPRLCTAAHWVPGNLAVTLPLAVQASRGAATAGGGGGGADQAALPLKSA